MTATVDMNRDPVITAGRYTSKTAALARLRAPFHPFWTCSARRARSLDAQALYQSGINRYPRWRFLRSLASTSYSHLATLVSAPCLRLTLAGVVISRASAKPPLQALCCQTFARAMLRTSAAVDVVATFAHALFDQSLLAQPPCSLAPPAQRLAPYPLSLTHTPPGFSRASHTAPKANSPPTGLTALLPRICTLCRLPRKAARTSY